VVEEVVKMVAKVIPLETEVADFKNALQV